MNMKQSLVIKTRIPIFRKYPGAPKAPENLSKVPMVSYPEKTESRFVLKSDQVRPEDYYIRFIPHVPE
jgi:hypothetical protein